jgi:hypothetical protein
MIEKYLKGETIRPWLEKRMIEGSLQEEYDTQLAIEKAAREEYLKEQQLAQTGE